MKIPIVSIIIVNYLSSQQLFDCIESIENSQTKLAYEVIVVDNDEKKIIQKSLKKRFPAIRYIENENRGYGQGNNIGASIAKGKYLFILNPDTALLAGAVDSLIDFLKNNPYAGIVAPLLLNPEKLPFPLQGTRELTPLRAFFALSFIHKLFPKNSIAKDYWLTNWDKTKIQEVDVVPGTAFMIKKTLFEKIGEFDEKFFLFFEETDFCKRVKILGYSLFIIPNAKVIHIWGESTKKSRMNIQEIFNRSRFYYFKKHFGIHKAIIIESLLRLNKTTIFLFGIILLGTFLRFYKLKENFFFDAEIGDNLLDVKNALIHGYLPLLGPPTSHPWLNFGPLFYWMYMPILFLSKYNPLSYSYFAACIAILIIPVHFFVIKYITTKRIAIISTIFITVSPLFLHFAYIARFFSIELLLIYPFLFVLYKIFHYKKRYFFSLGIILGIMLNFHYTPLVLIPFIFTVLVIKKIIPSFAQIVKFLCGLIIPLLPLLLYDLTHKAKMFTMFALWIPYRIAIFLKLYHSSTVPTQTIYESGTSIKDFFATNFFPHIASLGSSAVIGISLLYIASKFWSMRKTAKIDDPFIFFCLWGLWGLIGVVIHGNPPIHYFSPIIAFPIIIVSYMLSDIWNAKRFGKIIATISITLILISIVRFLFSTEWFYMYKRTPSTLVSRITVTKIITENARGKRFTFSRVGYYDSYPKQYAQDFLYVLWLYGNEPVTTSQLHYIVYDQAALPKQIEQNQKIFHISPRLAIIRQE